MGSHLSAVRSLNRSRRFWRRRADGDQTGWSLARLRGELILYNISLICYIIPGRPGLQHPFSEVAWMSTGQNNEGARVCRFLSLCVFALNGWITGCGSVPAWIRRTRGVSLLWGLCEALWGRRLVSGCMFPIGCFCWAKTQWGSGLFKEAVSPFCVCLCASVLVCFFLFFLFCLFTLTLITSHFIDETLMSSSHTDGGSFCVIKIWMEFEGRCYPKIRPLSGSLTTVQAAGKRATLGIATGGRKTRTTHVRLSYAVICYGLIPTSWMMKPILILI